MTKNCNALYCEQIKLRRKSAKNCDNRKFGLNKMENMSELAVPKEFGEHFSKYSCDLNKNGFSGIRENFFSCV